MLIHLGLCVGLLLPIVGTYVAWPSRWNIPIYQNIGLSLPSIILPSLFTGVVDQFPIATTSLYMSILLAGGATFIFGALTSRVLKIDFLTRRIEKIKKNEQLWTELISRRLVVTASLSLIGLWISFAVMGFLPIFSESPFEAKFFKGIYQEPYHRVAWLFRLSFTLANLLVPILLSSWWVTKRRKPLLLAGLLILSMILTLVRAGAVSGLLTFIGLVLVAKNRVITYLVICAVAFISGSAGYYLLGSIVGSETLSGLNVGDSFAEIVASGAPDISEDLALTAAFENSGEEFTYGRTFIGGLIPFAYKWSPPVWTLTTMNGLDVGDDISDVASGGLRVPVAGWGYFSFGWLGVALIPFMSGLALGLGVKIFKRAISNNNILLTSVILLFYSSFVGQMSAFYTISIYSAPAIAFSFFLLSLPNRRRKPAFTTVAAFDGSRK